MAPPHAPVVLSTPVLLIAPSPVMLSAAKQLAIVAAAIEILRCAQDDTSLV